MNEQPSVFISYSHKDENEKEQLLSHMGVLQHAGLIDLWSDDAIEAGAVKTQEMNQAIDKARVAILLISANFLTSDALKYEIPKLLERRNEERLVVFPVIAKACAWNKVPWLAKLQVRPRNHEPIWSDRGSHADEDLAAIAVEVANILEAEPPSLEELAKLEYVMPNRKPTLRDFRRWLQGE